MNRIAITFFFLCSSLLTLKAQVNDAGLWATVTIQKKLTYKLAFELENEFRMNENITEAGQNLTQAGLEYEIVKGFRAKLSYRFSQRRQPDDSYDLRHRLLTDFSYRRKAGRIGFVLRERLQGQVVNVQTGDDGFAPEYYARTKLTVRYEPVKKYRPFVSTEIFYPLNNPKRRSIDNIRYAAGIDYEFNKRHSATLYYMVDKELNVNNPLTSWITGIGYTYSY